MKVLSGPNRGAWAFAGLAAAGGAVAALAGCSTASSATGPGASPTGTTTAPSPSATAIVTPTAAASSPSASPPPATTSPASPSPPSSAPGAPSCPSSGLRVSLGSGSGAAGSFYRYIEFKNVSAVSCTLYGFPGVSLLGGNPARQIGAAATRAATSRPSLVTLVPGATASALLRVADAGNYPAAKCHPVASTALRVYPPNQTVPQTAPYAATGCADASVKLLEVKAVQP